MASQSYQAKADGTLELAYDPPHPRNAADREEPLRKGFEARGWHIDNISSVESSRKTTIKVRRGGHQYTVEAFVFPNLAWSSGGRSAYEKRIQLSRDYSEHKDEFNLPKDGDHRCALLGLYRRDSQVVICAWDAFAYRSHSNPSSCYVDVHAIADAMRCGLGQSIDSKQRLVCCFQPDLLPYYIENMRELHERLVVTEQIIHAAQAEGTDIAGPSSSTMEDVELPAEPNAVPAGVARNRVVYGAPGTGKSHKIADDISAYFPGAFLAERVTFHPDYTYSQFVGSYRPAPIYRHIEAELLDTDKITSAGRLEPLIDYRFVPGPFLRMLVRALKNPEHSFALVIEELNRANAPAVFGEVFQLLDRTADGSGKFSVQLPTDAQEYLKSVGLPADIRLPRNFYIWATMNSADQGVLPLDAAFKRRWTFEYQPLDAFESVTASWEIKLNFLNNPVSWNDFRHAINNHLLRREVTEDRLIGPFFMKEDELSDANAFTNKLLLYLRDDVVRHNPDALFKGSSLTYGALVDSYNGGANIFVDAVGLAAAES